MHGACSILSPSSSFALQLLVSGRSPLAATIGMHRTTCLDDPSRRQKRRLSQWLWHHLCQRLPKRSCHNAPLHLCSARADTCDTVCIGYQASSRHARFCFGFLPGSVLAGASFRAQWTYSRTPHRRVMESLSRSLVRLRIPEQTVARVAFVRHVVCARGCARGHIEIRRLSRESLSN